MSSKHDNCTPDVYARILRLAHRVSLARLETFLWPPERDQTSDESIGVRILPHRDEPALIHVVVPALRVFLQTLPPSALSTELHSTVVRVADELRARLVELVRTEFRNVTVICPLYRTSSCAICTKLDRFVANHETRELTLSIRKVPHVEKTLGASFDKLRRRIQIAPASRPGKASLRKIQSALVTRGEAEARALGEILTQWLVTESGPVGSP